MSGGDARRAGTRRLLTLLTAGLLAGCVDSGLPDRNLPRAQAERRVFEYPAYQMAAPRPEVLELAGRRWLPSFSIETIQPALLRPVAETAGTRLYALAWDSEPFDRLYLPVGQDRWRTVEHVF